MTFRLLALSIAIALVSGCTANSPTKSPKEHEPKPAQEKPAEAPTGPLPPAAAITPGKANTALTTGLDLYAAGKHAEAVKSLNLALTQGGLTNPQRIVAHKHLAFVYCTSKRPRQCRTEFAKALKIDPALELEPAEAGHPTWGPVFKKAKKRQPPSK